jgi:anthranilate synthase component 1
VNGNAILNDVGGYQISKIENLKADDAIAIFGKLHAHFASDRSIAFFRTSDSVGETFIPTLSILGIQPSLLLQRKNGEVKLERIVEGSSKSKTEIRQGNPFAVLSEMIIDQKVPVLPEHSFFQGGALGYFGYDAVKYLEPVLQKTKNLSLNSDRYDSEIVFFKNYLVFDHARSDVSLWSEDAGSANDFRGVLEKLSGDLSTPLSSPLSSSPNGTPEALPLSEFKTSFGKDAFIEAVKFLKNHIKDGNIFQAVLSEKFKHAYPGDAFQLFLSLLAVNPAPYHFFFTIDGRDFMGASPEMLLKEAGEKIETHPIAGTRPRGKNPEEEKRNELQLLDSVKEKAEHLMLVDLARNDIGRVSTPGSVKVESFQKLRKFGGVMHLVSKVTGTRLPGLHALGALASCFPAGTLSGAPKIRAMTLLANLEPETRGFYGGAFIAASVTGRLDSCISIRSMSIDAGEVTIQAGAGIVADSSPEKEYLEIEHKSRLARKALAHALAVGTNATSRDLAPGKAARAGAST